MTSTPDPNTEDLDPGQLAALGAAHSAPFGEDPDPDLDPTDPEVTDPDDPNFVEAAQ